MSKHTLPFTAIGRSNIPCIPRIADCGGLIIGVPNNEPNTPPLLIVNVPPSISSIESEPFFAYENENVFHLTRKNYFLLFHQIR
jgi:hypothetical protein